MADVLQSDLSITDRIRQLIDEGRTREALDLIRKSGSQSPELKNAYGVCLLRLGEIEKAVAVFRSLLFRDGGVSITSDAPAVYKTNFATALLLANNVSGCMTTLDEVGDDKNPAVIKIKSAVAKWKKSLGAGTRIMVAIGAMRVDKPVAIDFPPGDL